MKLYVGITDNKWFNLLRASQPLDEVNFWQPSGNKIFKTLSPGELFLFKLHSPLNYIVGGGLFAHSSILPISLAWEAFGRSNGAESFNEMRANVARFRNNGDDRNVDFNIGCILIEQPFFLPEDKWIPVPYDWKPGIQQGKSYDLSVEPGHSLWE